MGSDPYGIAFDPLGNLFTADCHSKPAYCLLRGAHYPSFRYPHDGLGFGPKLIDHSHGSTSISGIGYYEVPLNHPRRDKTRGRIWRVVYRGEEDERHTPGKIHDLTTLTLRQLWDRLADPNLAVQLPTTHEIADRFGPRAVQPVRDWMIAPNAPSQRVHALWVLHRLNALDDELTTRLAEDESSIVRVHLVKSLAERTDWDTGTLSIRELVQRKLLDEDGFVRRAAADALGRHPHPANVPLLLRLWNETDREDTYLIHTIRMSLRDQLAQDEIFREYAHFDGDANRRRRLLDVLLGLPKAHAAEFVLSALNTGRYDPTRLDEFIADPQCVDLIDGILGNQGESFTLRRASARALRNYSGEESRQVFCTHLLIAHHRLAITLAAGLAGSQKGAEMLLDAIAEGKASPLLLRELRVLMALKVTKVPDLMNRIAKLTENLPPADEMTAQQIAQRRDAYRSSKPEAELGRPVFDKQCGICHQLSGQGRKFGPDLDGIGVRGLDRLLEDLLDPSRNVDPAFQTTIVITDRGLTHTGLALRDEGKTLLLVDSEGKELRIPHDEIDKM